MQKEKFDETGSKEIFLYDGTNVEEALYFLRADMQSSPPRIHELIDHKFIIQLADISIYPGSVLAYFEEEDEYKFFIPD